MKNSRLNVTLCSVVAVVIAYGFSDGANVQAATYSYGLGTVVNGDTPTGGPGSPPWLTATFEDIASNQVKLTLHGNLAASEYVDYFAFNINPVYTPSDVSVVPDAADPDPTVSKGAQNAQGNLSGAGDAYKNGWDFVVNYSSSNSGGGVQRLNGTEYDYLTVTFVGSPTLDAFDFAFAAANGLLGMAHIGGIPGDKSGAIAAVPVPPTLLMLVSSIVPMFGARHLLRRRKLTSDN